MKSSSARTFRLLTLAWLRGIVRDRATVFWMFAFPVLFVVIFGLAFGREQIGPFDIGVATDVSDPAGQGTVDALNAAFQRVEPFDVQTGTRAELLGDLEDGDLYAVIAVESGGQGAGQGAAADAPTPAKVVLHVDPSRGAAVQIVTPIARQVIDGVDRQLSGSQPVLTVEERSVRSASLSFLDFFLPGVVGFSIMQAGMFAAIPLVQLRTTRVLKRFAATPVSRWAVLGSQGLARLILAVATTAVLLAMGRLLYGVEIGANWAGMVGFVVLGTVVFLAFGFAVSGLASTDESVPALVQVISFPMMFLAGVFWPVENFPSFIQPISRVLPLTFLGDGLRQTMVGGAALNPLWLDAVALAAWTVAALVAAVRLFKWE